MRNIKAILIFSVLIFLMRPNLISSTFNHNIGVGSRAKGMGNAFTAIADDVYAVYWNPAGLVDLEEKYFTFMHRDLYSLGLITYNYFGYAQSNVGDGAIGFGLIRMGTTANVSFMDYAENTYIFSYGRKMDKVAENISVGINVKYYYVDYDDGKCTGYGMDAGVKYLYNGVRLGLMLVDINSPLLRWDTGTKERISPDVRLGAATFFHPSLNVSFELSELNKRYKKAHLGLENNLFDGMVALRAGVFSPSRNLWNITLGAGLEISGIKLDYAYEYHMELGSNHLYSLDVRF